MIHFVVHDENDSVGVVVVEGLKAGQELTGWIMDQDKEIRVRAQSDLPIGHKLAIRELKSGDTVIKYGVDIGRTIFFFSSRRRHTISDRDWSSDVCSSD